MGATAAYLALVAAPIEVPQIVHAVAGPLLTLYLPGRALLRAVGRVAPDVVSHALLASGTSIVLTILTGLVLEVLPGPDLTAGAWRLALAILATVLGVFGLVSAPAEARSGSAPAPRPALLLAIVPLALVAGAVLLSMRSQESAPEAPFSELWAVTTQEGRVIVGLRNHEGEPTSYRIAVRPAPAGLDDALVVRLDDGTTWTSSIAAPANSGEDGSEIVLFRSGDERPYRRVDIPTPSGRAVDDQAGGGG